MATTQHRYGEKIRCALQLDTPYALDGETVTRYMPKHAYTMIFTTQYTHTCTGALPTPTVLYLYYTLVKTLGALAALVFYVTCCTIRRDLVHCDVTGAAYDSPAPHDTC